MKRVLAVLLSGGIFFHGSDSYAAALMSAAAATSHAAPCLVQIQAVVQPLRASWWGGSTIDQKGAARMARSIRQIKQSQFRDPWDAFSPLRFQSDGSKSFKDIEHEVNGWTIKKLLTLETRFNQVRNSEDLAEWVTDGMIVEEVLSELGRLRDPRKYPLEERLQEAIRVEAARQVGDGVRVGGISPLVAQWMVNHEAYFHDIDPPFAARVTFLENVRARSYYLERLDDVLYIRPEGDLRDDPPSEPDNVAKIKSAMERLRKPASSPSTPTPKTSAYFPSPVTFREANPEGLLAKVRSVLNRHAPQWQWIREYVLPAIITRAHQTGNRSLRVLVLGASTGEEMARAYAEIASAIAEQESPEAWTIRITGLEKSATLVKKGRARLAGETPFPDSYGSGRSAYAKSIMDTLNKYGPQAKASMLLEQTDITDFHALQPYLDVDLILMNNVLIYLKPSKSTELLNFIDQQAPHAFLATTEHRLFSESHHQWTKSSSPPHWYYFAVPKIPLWPIDPFLLQTLSKSALYTHPVAFLAAILLVPGMSPALGTGLIYSALGTITVIGILRGFYPLLRRWINRPARDFLTVFTPEAAQRQFSEMYLEPLDQGVGFQLRSVDQDGESHVEGWVTYENLPVGVFITHIELAPWNTSRTSPRLTGVGSLLVKAVLREALLQNKEIRTLPKDPWSHRFFHQFGFAGFWTSHPIMTPKKARTLLENRLTLPLGRTPISIQDETPSPAIRLQCSA